MTRKPELADYMQEIRKQVCTKCVDRPAGGPPCAPLGKTCGVELHLAEVVNAVHQIHSPMLGPYLDHNRSTICDHCLSRHGYDCPCAMDYLAALLVAAVETVDAKYEELASV